MNRTVNIAGHTHALEVIGLSVECGDIAQGVALAFADCRGGVCKGGYCEQSGAWVISLQELQAIAREAEEHQAVQP